MRGLISFLVVLILCVAAIGFGRGWFTLSGPTRDGDGNKVNVELSVDPAKVQADATQVKDKASELSGQDADKPE
jgi:major membrane immunogen (membrane-anchored lipoprotein)